MPNGILEISWLELQRAGKCQKGQLFQRCLDSNCYLKYEMASTRDTGVIALIPGGPNDGSAPNIAPENLSA
jgi:hypothetical protein